MHPTLETERLRLRPFRLDDAEAMFAGWTGDDEVTKYLTWPTHKSVEDTKALLARWVAEYERIDVVRYEDGCPVLGYNLSRPYWGRGVMTEACRRLLDYLFSQGYAEVRIAAMVENVGSRRVIEKCGGEYVDTVEDYLPLKDRTVKINRYVFRAK